MQLPCLRLLLRHKVNGTGINAVAHIGWRSGVLEEVAEVLLALQAEQLNPLLPIGI